MTTPGEPEPSPRPPVMSPDRDAPPISDERWGTIHPKLLDVLIDRLGHPGAMEITNDGIVIYFDDHETR